MVVIRICCGIRKPEVLESTMFMRGVTWVIHRHMQSDKRVAEDSYHPYAEHSTTDIFPTMGHHARNSAREMVVRSTAERCYRNRTSLRVASKPGAWSWYR